MNTPDHLDELLDDDFCSDGLHETLEEIFLIMRSSEDMERAVDRVACAMREAYEDISKDQSIFFADGVVVGLFLAQQGDLR